MTTPGTTSTLSPARAASAWGVLAVLGVWLAATAAVILGDAFAHSRAAQDQDNYHLMAVQKFAEELPRADLGDYRSATTPGYHLALAEFSRLVSKDPAAVRGFGALFTLGLLLTLGVCASGRSAGAGALVLPVACSLYVFSAGAWILPDNAGWWGVVGVLAIALFRAPSAAMILAAGGVLVMLVMCRQIHLWAAGVVWLWALVGGPWAAPTVGARVRMLALAVVATLPAFATVGAFYSLWHGPVPPLFQGGVFDPVIGKVSPKNTGPNPATPAFLLTLFAIFGVFFAGYFAGQWRRVQAGDRGAMAVLAAGAGLGLLAGVLPITSFSVEAGRYTGFWAVVPKLPVVHGRSVFIAAGACAGGVVLAGVLASLRRREAVILGGAVLAFGAAQTTAFAAWQRYMEPMVLLVLVLAAIAPRREDGAPGVWRGAAAGPVLLALALAGITYASLR